MTAVEYLTLGVECYLRSLDDAAFGALVSRVRPTPSEHPDIDTTERNTH